MGHISEKRKESYNLLQYREEVVLKTLLIKEDHLFNVSHMVLGMGSEILSELPVAEKLMNETNRIEELGDIEFFAIGYAHFEDIELPAKAEIRPMESLCDPLDLMRFSIGCLQTIVKKELVSGVKKLDGVVVTKEKLTEIVHTVLASIQMYANYWNLDLEETVRPANARKLNVRYDGGGFTAEQSLNRDYEKEDQALKGVDRCSCGTNEACSNCPKTVTMRDFTYEANVMNHAEFSRDSDYKSNFISKDIFDFTVLFNKKQYEAFRYLYFYFMINEITDTAEDILIFMKTAGWVQDFLIEKMSYDVFKDFVQLQVIKEIPNLIARLTTDYEKSEIMLNSIYDVPSLKFHIHEVIKSTKAVE